MSIEASVIELTVNLKVMRYPIVFVVMFSCFAANGLVYSQNISTGSGKQLEKIWERSGNKGEKEGLIEGNAVLVFEGDTIGVVTKDGSRYTIRLRGIDAPENRQPYGLESANQLASLVQGMEVVAIVGQPDLNNRYVGAVYIDSEDVSLTQIRKGMAWTSFKTDSSFTKQQRDAFKQAEDRARTERIGLWASTNPIAPWIFRGEGSEQPEEPNRMVGRSESPTKVLTSPSTSSAASPAAAKPVTTDSRKYMLGPRGGCYYLNDQGIKVYVRNKELCTKQ